jgi:WD40 repeat protein
MEEYINFLDTYYDKKNDKFYILNGNSKNVKVFNFEDLSVYKIYKQKEASFHPQIIIYEDEKNNKTQLIESDMRGFIHIWDFHTSELIKDISLKTVVNGICLWDEQYLITTGKDKLIKIVDIQKSEIIRTLSEHQVETIAVQKISLSKYGECLLSHGKDGIIKLWSLNK